MWIEIEREREVDIWTEVFVSFFFTGFLGHLKPKPVLDCKNNSFLEK